MLAFVICLFQSQISEMKASGANSAVRTLLLDPAVNFVIEKLKRELSDTKAKLEETQSELSAWKFTPDRCDLCYILRRPDFCYCCLMTQTVGLPKPLGLLRTGGLLRVDDSCCAGKCIDSSHAGLSS